MKTTTILYIASLIMFPVIGLAQTSEIQVAPTQPATAITSSQITPVPSSSTKCGVTSFEVRNECGVGVYKNAYIQCSDGYKPILGDESSCKSSDVWNQYAKETCANRYCSNSSIPQPILLPRATATPTTFGGNTGGGSGAISITPTNTTTTTSTTAGCVAGAAYSLTTGAPCVTTTVVPAPTPTPSVTSPTTDATLRYMKCGVNSFSVSNECGLGVYKNVYAQCYDGFETNLGAVESSCKTADLWNQYAKDACANHCSNGERSGTVSTSMSAPIIYAGEATEGGNRLTPLIPLTQKPVEMPKATPVCYIGDYLFQKYNLLIIELQKSESDKTRTELITKEIIALKQQISTQQNDCVNNSPQSTATIVPWPAPTTVSQSVSTLPSLPISTENIPVAVSMDRCNEVTQWENKIAYYKKLSSSNDDELKKNGFSRGDIEKILQELSLGIEQVRAQCNTQNRTIATPSATITGSASISETVRPVVIESGQEIGTYYKAMLEKAVSAKGADKQIQELKTLRDEIDSLISNLIKSRKELEVSELNSLVKKVTVSPGEIKADDISVKTTEKKMLVNIGDRPVSVEPTESQVLIRDKGLEVNTNEVTITENVLSVGGVAVKMSASEVTEKLGLVPTIIELKKEDNKAVYNMKIEEQRKLFGFIPFNSQKTVTADAENGNALSEQLPWYNFLTTK